MLKKFLANNFALSDAESNIFEVSDRGDVADLPLLKKLLVIRLKSQKPSFWEVMDSFGLVTYANLTASRTLVTSLSELYFRCRRFILLLHTKTKQLFL